MKRSFNAPALLSAILGVVALILLVRLAEAVFVDGTRLVQASSRQSGAQAPPQSGAASAAHSAHSITVKFDYNFTLTPACSDKIVDHCTQRFMVYDISAGIPQRSKLFTIPVPEGAKGMVQGITATSPKLDFESGKHQVAVTAQEPSGVESPNYAATVWVVIP